MDVVSQGERGEWAQNSAKDVTPSDKEWAEEGVSKETKSNILCQGAGIYLPRPSKS